MPASQIIVVPRNGYANRLQAWASASLLGAEWDVPVTLCWEPESIAPASLPDLFDVNQIPHLMSPEELEGFLGQPHRTLPRYLNQVPERSLITLAGHDRGEQVFMSELSRLVGVNSAQTTIVVIAGGHFGIGSTGEQRAGRRDFYHALAWSKEIESATQRLLNARNPFLGLHIRQTDRSRSAPTVGQIHRAMKELGNTTGVTDVFLAADTADAVCTWQSRLLDWGFRPWHAPTRDYARDSRPASVDALIEWRTLSHAVGLVFSAQSSFGAEAAVAAGEIVTRPLMASSMRQRSRTVHEILNAAVTYPKRHGWINRE